MTDVKLKEFINPDLDLILSLANIFGIKQIDTEFYKYILVIYTDNEISGMINLCLMYSMRGKNKLYIRDIFYKNNKYIDIIVKSLCKYCNDKNYSIIRLSSAKSNENEYMQFLLNNNFTINDNFIYHK